MASKKRRNLLDRIGKWILDILDKNSSNQASAASVSSTNTCSYEDSSGHILIKSSTPEEIAAPSAEHQESTRADSVSAEAIAKHQSDDLSANRDHTRHKEILRACTYFRLTLQKAGLSSNLLLEGDRLVFAISRLDQDFIDHLLECLNDLSGNPGALSCLASMIARGHVSSSDPPQLIRALRFLRVIFVAEVEHIVSSPAIDQESIPRRNTSGEGSGAKKSFQKGQPDGKDNHWVSRISGPSTQQRDFDALAVGSEPDLEPINNMAIREIDISGRTASRLEQNGIYSLRDLADRNEEDLLGIWHFGEKSVCEVREALKKLDLSLPFDRSLISTENQQEKSKSDKPAKVNQTSYNDIYELGVSPRLMRSLWEADIKCIDDLVCYTEKDLRRIQGLGPVTLRQISRALAKKGRSLATSSPASVRANAEDDEPEIAEAEWQRLEPERLAAEVEAQRQAEEEEQARQAAEAERQRLEQERLTAEAEAQRQAEEEEQALLLSREGLDSGTSDQWAPDIKAQSEQLADQRSNDESPQNQQDSQVEPEDWQQWKEGDWNRCLLRYCFLGLGESDTRIGVPSSVEDLRFAVGDPKANPSELADAFVKSIISQAERNNAKPGRLFTKRAENWNPDTPLEPPFFAFLWATCLISQGYPNPYEPGQFHMRYLRVFGAEQRSAFKSLKLGWEKLSHWLEQEKALGGEEHRMLTLPSELGKRTNIGYSWYLSFPSRNDRAELASVIQQLLDDGIPVAPPTAQALFVIKRTGRFGAEFARTLDKQIRAANNTGVVDDWFAGIIEHEYDQLQSAADNTPSTARRSGRPGNPDLSLQLDLEDPSQIELVLPRQELTGLEESNQSVTFCTLDPVGTEHPWDPRKGIVSISKDVCQVVTETAPAWTWKLRSGSSSGYTLKRWNCAGIEPGDHPILCFCAESGQRISGKSILSSASEAWFFAPKNLQPTPTESVEILDELRWGVSLKGWRGYLLRLAQPKAELLWQGADESGAQQTVSLPWSVLDNVTPVLRGSLIDKKERVYMSSPSLWIPPLSEPAKLILTIKDLGTNQLLSDTSELIMLQESDEWSEIDLTECIETESRFSIMVQPEQDHPDLPNRWRTTFQVHKPYEQQDHDEIVAPLLTCLHNDRPISRQIDAGFYPFFYEDVSDFWLARWLLERVWPMESLELAISNGIDSCQDTLIADQEGTLEISAAVYRYMLQGEVDSISISVLRQGEQNSYVLATAGDEMQSIPLTTSMTAVVLPPPDSPPASPKTSPSRGRPMDFVITFQPRFTGKNAKKQIADFTKYMKQLIAEAGIPAEELHPQNLDNDVWIRVTNQEHLSVIDDLLEEAGEMCGFKILKQRRR